MPDEKLLRKKTRSEVEPYRSHAARRGARGLVERALLGGSAASNERRFFCFLVLLIIDTSDG